MKDKAGLTGLEKEYVIREKQEFYLMDAEKKGAEKKHPGGFSLDELVEEQGDAVLERIRNGQLHITGYEFRTMPPTAIGDELVRQNILLVAKSVDYFRELLEDKTVWKGKEALEEQLSKLAKAAEKTLGVWLSSEERPDKEIRAYEKAVRDFFRNLALMVINGLKKELPDEPAEIPDATKWIGELIAAHPDDYKIYKKLVDKAAAEYKAMWEKQCTVMKDLPRIRKLVEEKGLYTKVYELMTLSGALHEWEGYLEEQLAAAVYVQHVCEDVIKWFLAGETADPLSAHYAEQHFRVTIPTIPLFQTPMEFRNFAVPGVAPEVQVETVEDILRVAGELDSLVEKNRRLFDYPNITTLLFGTEDVPQIGVMARALRDCLAKGFVKGEYASLEEVQVQRLKEILFNSETVMHLCESIMGYIRNSMDKTVRELVGSYKTDIAALQFSVQYAACSKNLAGFTEG